MLLNARDRKDSCLELPFSMQNKSAPEGADPLCSVHSLISMWQDHKFRVNRLAHTVDRTRYASSSGKLIAAGLRRRNRLGGTAAANDRTVRIERRRISRIHQDAGVL